MSALNPSTNYIDKSVHGVVSRGSEIRVLAQGSIPSVGSCRLRIPAMQVKVLRNGHWDIVRTFHNVNASLKSYSVYLPYRVRASDVQVQFTNDC